jgi:hypothetical protein
MSKINREKLRTLIINKICSFGDGITEFHSRHVQELIYWIKDLEDKLKLSQQWISVEDKVPTVNEDDKFDLKYGFSKEVIVKMRDGTYAVGIYCKNSNSFSLKGSTLAYRITHWRPIEIN